MQAQILVDASGIRLLQVIVSELVESTVSCILLFKLDCLELCYLNLAL